MMTYIFLDPIVFLAYRVPHLSHDMLPPLADYDYTKNLVKRSFKVRTYISWAQLSSTLSVSTWILFLVVPKGISFGVSWPFFVCLSTELHFLLTYALTGQEYIQMSILVIIRVISTLMAPIGMNQLLRCAS
jgi:hypothetical protein